MTLKGTHKLLPGAKPMHLHPYPVPPMHWTTFKCEINHLDKIGVLIPMQESEWTSPSFVIAKKDGSSCWSSVLCQLM